MQLINGIFLKKLIVITYGFCIYMESEFPKTFSGWGPILIGFTRDHSAAFVSLCSRE